MKHLRRAISFKPSLVLMFVALSASLFLVTGCGSTKVTAQSQNSVGQQLTDLEKAYKDGVITEKEYERLKRRIVKDND